MNYSDEQIDIGVAIAGGGYRISWGDLDVAYWNPPPDEKFWEDIYVIEWDSKITVDRVPVEKLQYVVREPGYLEMAQAAVQSYLGEELVSSELPLLPVGGTAGNVVNTYVTCIGGEQQYDTDLDTAKWRVIGVWALENIQEIQNPTYLKTSYDNVFMVDENTFLIL